MKRRVLYITHNHVSAAPGGVEVYASELYEAVRRSGRFEPMLLARSGAPHTSNVVPHAGTAISSAGEDRNQYLFFTDAQNYDFFLQTSRRKYFCTQFFREFLQAYKPDLIHFHHTLFLGVEFIVEARHTLPDTPIVYTLHEYVPICHNHGQMVRTHTNEPCLEASPRRCHACFPEISPQAFFLRNRFISSHFEAVDQFIAPSRFLLDRFVQWGIPREKILFEQYGRTFASPRDAGREPGSAVRFGFFGRLTSFKGITVLLEAVRLLIERGAGPMREGGGTPAPDGDFHVYIHGTGLEQAPSDYRERVQRLLEATSARVTFLGPYDRARLPQLMAAVDWVIVPSIWWENSPLVIQEAFACGRPVICSDIGGMAENVDDGATGLHFRVNDPWSLAETMMQVMRTPQLRDQMRARIRPVHAMETHVDTLAGIYNRLLHRTEQA
jgi:glycosyltransferase involved in cell wall biosynthesis